MPSIIQAWASLYANHVVLRTAVVFAHIGGLAIGGGAAITADWGALIAFRAGMAERAAHLRLLARTHRVVLIALGFVVASGLLQFASDTGTFLHSKVFWIKMAMVAALLANGGRMLRVERQAAPTAADPAAGWRRLRTASVASMSLWLAIALAGSALINL